jgi:uncharacterized membrane protein
MSESKKRSLIKTITWRIVAIISSFVITYLFLGDILQSVSLTILLNVTAVILYYFHERVWNSVKWGRR